MNSPKILPPPSPYSEIIPLSLFLLSYGLLSPLIFLFAARVLSFGENLFFASSKGGEKKISVRPFYHLLLFLLLEGVNLFGLGSALLLWFGLRRGVIYPPYYSYNYLETSYYLPLFWGGVYYLLILLGGGIVIGETWAWSFLKKGPIEKQRAYWEAKKFFTLLSLRALFLMLTAISGVLLGLVLSAGAEIREIFSLTVSPLSLFLFGPIGAQLLFIFFNFFCLKREEKQWQ